MQKALTDLYDPWSKQLLRQTADDDVESLTLMLIDSARERRINLGKKYPYPSLDKQECIVDSSLANTELKNAAIGDDIMLKLSI